MKRRLLWSALVLVLLVAAIAGTIVHDLHRLKVTELRFVDPKLNGRPITFLQISDFHNGRGPGAQQVLATVEKTRPHYIVLTGDLVNTSDDDLSPLTTLLSGLAGHEIPIFAVWGNHEHWGGRIPGLTTLLESHGVTILDDEAVVLTQHGQQINLVGTDDYSTGNGDLAKAMAGVDTSLFTVVISHSPEIAPHLAGHDVDLALVGHTHGGQVRLPLLGCLRAPNQGWWPTYCSGLYDVGDAHLWVDSGVGWSVGRVRFGVQAQVSAVTVVMPSQR